MLKKITFWFILLSSAFILGCDSGSSSENGSDGEGGGGTGPGEILVPFQRTETGYAWNTTDFDSVCSETFGIEYRMADWTEIKAYIAENSADDFFTMTGMIDYRSNGWVSNNGSELQSSGRHYFIERHDGTVPSGWAVHDSIGSHVLDLGSWNNSRPVICTCQE